jgi:hypothetical protein
MQQPQPQQHPMNTLSNILGLYEALKCVNVYIEHGIVHKEHKNVHLGTCMSKHNYGEIGLLGAYYN